MSYSRNLEPQLFSIQAIIQKSEFSNKTLNSIPADLKKLFINQAACKTNNFKKHDVKRASQFFLSKNSYFQSIGNQAIRIPPLPPRENKSKSMNTSKEHSRKPNSVNSTRATKNIQISGKKPIEVLTRYPINAPNYRHTIDIDIKQKIEAEYLVSKEAFKSPQDPEQAPKKISRFSYEFIMPVNKQQKRRLSKNYNETGIEPKIDNREHSLQSKSKQIKMTITEGDENETKDENQGKNEAIKKKAKGLLQIIPDYVVAALTEQAREVSVGRSNKVTAKVTEINFNESSPVPEQKMREVRHSNCVIQMKKKIDYNKTKRSEQSVEQNHLEPIVNYLKIVKKQKFNSLRRIQSEHLSKDHKRSKPVSAQKQRRRKNIISEEDVCGWEVKEGPVLDDCY